MTPPAVAPYRLSLVRFGGALFEADEVDHDEPALGGVSLALSREFVQQLRLLDPVSLLPRIDPALFRLTDPSTPTAGISLPLPIVHLGSTALLRLGARGPIAVGGSQMSAFTAPQDQPYGFGGGVTLRISDNGTAGIFGSVFGAPIVGGVSAGALFHLSDDRDH